MKRPSLEPHGIVYTLLLVLLFNTFVTVLLVPIMPYPAFDTLIFSQCIGLSIFTLTAIFGRVRQGDRVLYQPSKPVMAASVVAGGVFGVSLAAWFTLGDPILLWEQHAPIMWLSLSVAIGVGTVATLIFLSRSRMWEARLALAEANAARAAGERRLAETQLRLLQAQIEPHFLFNTLSNVSALIDIEPTRARHMLDTFTRYLRFSLARTRAPIATLGNEIDLLEAYLQIQSVRMGDRLRYRFDIPEELRSLPLAPLLLQPLVENAIRHGLELAPTGGMVAITAMRSGQRIELSVTDTGAGLGSGRGHGEGVGLENVRQRLAMLYGSDATLSLIAHEPTGLIARIELPIEDRHE